MLFRLCYGTPFQYPVISHSLHAQLSFLAQYLIMPQAVNSAF